MPSVQLVKIESIILDKKLKGIIMSKHSIKKLNMLLIGITTLFVSACNSGSNQSTNQSQPPSFSETTGLNNQLNGFGKTGTPGYTNTVPVLCFQNANGVITAPPLGYGQTLFNLAQYSGNQYYAGATIHAGGCDATNDPYLGYIDFSISPDGPIKFNSYQNKSAVHINFNNLSVNSNGTLTGTPVYTSIDSNLNDSTLSPLSVNRSLPYVGVNLSGLEFSSIINTTTIPDLSITDANDPSMSQYSDLATMRQFVQGGLNTVRIPISWGFLALGGMDDYTLNMTYWTNFVQPLLETLTSAGVYTILDLHSYMHYSWMGNQISGCNSTISQCPDGTLDTNPNDYVGIWKNIYAQINSDSNIKQQYLMMDIFNEPVAAPGETLTATQVYNAEVPVALYLQSQNFPGKILLEGNNWSGLHSWTTLAYADGKTNADVFTKANLEASGLNTNNILINVHQYLDSDFSGTQSTCQPASALTSTGTNGFNLDAFSNYLQTNDLQAIVTETGAPTAAQASCQDTLSQFVSYLNQHAANGSSGGFVGMTLWGAGHGWGNYNLFVGPTTYQFTTLMNDVISK